MSRRNVNQKKRRSGSMSNMRSGFKRAVSSKKKKKKGDSKQFLTILAVLFLVGVVMFMMSQP